MPVKNAGTFLAPCIESILAQYYQNWELIAINDHSSDNTGATLQSYADQDDRIQFFDNPGHGIIAALQTAYKKCTGSFITRMDADDLCAQNKLSHLAKSLCEHGKGHLAVGQVKYFAEEGLGDGYLAYEGWLNQLTAAGKNFDELYKECVVPSPCWMLYREDFDQLGAFNADLYPEDYELCFRFYKAGLSIIPCSEVLHHWRDYSSRTSRTDSNYADNSFLNLKIKYFLRLHRNPSRPLVLWGGGKRGKRLARLLLELKQEFHWVCNNPQKIGHHIYEVQMHNTESINELPNPQVLVTVAVPGAQIKILKQMEDVGLLNLKDYFMLC